MTTLWSGIAIGAIYGLVALQFDLIYTATNIFNFAQTGLLVITSLLAYVLLVAVGLPWPFVVLVLIGSGALLGMVQEVLTLRPLQWVAGSNSHAWIVTTLGAGTALEGIAYLIFGPDPLAVPFPGGSIAMTVLGGRVLPVEVSVVVAVIVATLCMRFFLTRSRMGLATMATALDRDLAMLRGINVRRVALGSFAVAGGLVGASTLVIAPITFASYDMGQQLTVFAFAVLAMGGFGTQIGALLGGLAVGLVQAFSSFWIGPEAGPLIVLALLLLVLSIRPAGLFASRGARIV